MFLHLCSLSAGQDGLTQRATHDAGMGRLSRKLAALSVFLFALSQEIRGKADEPRKYPRGRSKFNYNTFQANGLSTTPPCCKIRSSCIIHSPVSGHRRLSVRFRGCGSSNSINIMSQGRPRSQVRGCQVARNQTLFL